ncbi:MAG TPA: HIT family protein [Anaerolineales bacterium]|nr:HIT family protein [Anaerolineales bacterium]
MAFRAAGRVTRARPLLWMDIPTNCIFCRIVRGQAEASMVHEDETVVAFLDSHPVATGHVLVVPRRHASGLEDLDDESGARMFAVARRVALALRHEAWGADGVNLHLADGTAAGQSVFHAHLHVIPRHAGDGFGLRMPFGVRPTPNRKALDEIAARVRASMPAGRA